MENAYAVSRFLLSGSGGQGVITMAILLAEAAVKYEGLVAVQSQSYGPEARGGATRSDVILSHKAIYYPKVEATEHPRSAHRCGLRQVPAADPPRQASVASMIPSSCIRAARWEAQFKRPAALGRGQGTPRFGGFVQRGRARSARDADRSGTHRLDRDGAGGTFPGGTP